MIQRVLMVDDRRGQGVDEDPVRLVHKFYHEKSLDFICEWDNWSENELRALAHDQVIKIAELQQWKATLQAVANWIWGYRDMVLDSITTEELAEINREIDRLIKFFEEHGEKVGGTTGHVLNLRRDAPQEGRSDQV